MRQPASRILGPALTMAATWATRKGLNNAYQRRTGQNPPMPSDPNVSLGRVIMWAAITAVVLTTVDVLINRTLSAVDGVIAEREKASDLVAVEADETS